jgi:predicted short-subunit dehydrogenase-like oxidoreductase (DUF2520 family)
MLPEMRAEAAGRRSKKRRITIVGAGNLANVLAGSLHASGYRIDQIIARERSESLLHAGRLAARVGATAVSSRKVQISADVIWFCVPDRAIREAAAAIESSTDWSGKVALHSSGTFTSDELGPLRRRGAVVASAHPLMTFVHGSKPKLAGVPFAIEGDRKAARIARTLVINLGGTAYSIRAEDKPAYHAWGTLASPLFTALLATCEQVAAAAGVKRNAAKKKMLPMLKQTLANYEALDAAGTFSGPIVRGDVETVKRHLGVLRKAPVARAVYIALAQAALAYLPAKNKDSLKRVFNPHSL